METSFQATETQKQTESSNSITRFDSKVAIVTGASDRGIGGAIAERLAQEGAAVALLTRSEPKRLLKRLTRQERTSSFSQCDVTDGEQVLRSVEETARQLGRIDVLVNNAGVEYAR